VLGAIIVLDRFIIGQGGTAVSLLSASAVLVRVGLTQVGEFSYVLVQGARGAGLMHKSLRGSLLRVSVGDSLTRPLHVVVECAGSADGLVFLPPAAQQTFAVDLA
jgi:hypothetical protein